MERISFSELEISLNELPWNSSQRTISSAVVRWLRDKVPYYNWVGIYWVKDGDLVLGPWSGPTASQHVHIPGGTGICGLSANEGKTVIVPDVRAEPGYLACFINTRSEIVVPILRDGEIIGVLDIDSDDVDPFNIEDQEFLEKILIRLAEKE
ncbi:MAG: GAF domain-containing protein [Calditrichaeota bacterium]|jgi:L-methionine (R)-S-oxide reductase|nr:GAF domain-containing protein [Calditrichota bacterium]MBT7618029.1 GAF domain-containing protein [Calditrichota bacterium]MBT7789465.1 GAF domain-containing protein [Calditrichota bacterium]